MRERALLFRQLHTMLAAGMALVPSLEAICEGTWSPALYDALVQIRDAIHNGHRPSQAFARHPRFFPRSLTGMLAMGERSGRLVAVLERIADLLEASHKQLQKMQAALLYPCLTFVAALLALGALLVFVLPKMLELTLGLHLKLTPLLETMLTVASWLCSPWVLMLLLEAAAMSVLAAWWWTQKTAVGRSFWHRFSLDVPGLGPVLRAALLSRLCHDLAQMLVCGCPLLDALQLTAGSLDHDVYSPALQRVARELREGTLLSDAFAAAGPFPGILVSFVKVSEEAANLDHLLLRLHELQEEDLNLRLDTFASLLEPLIMAGLGLLVGGLVILFFLPLTQIVGQLS